MSTRNERIDAWIARHRDGLVLTLIVVVYGLALVWTGGMTHPFRVDENHFWETTRDYFIQPFPPSAQTLREYPELITPLSYVIWGQLELLTGRGFVAGRVLNLLMSLSVLLLLAGSRRDPVASLGAALGILAYPYFSALSIHLYTDMIGAFFLVFGLHLHLRGRPWWGCALFVLAIATRQYLVQVPAALVVWEGLRWLAQRDRDRFVAVLAPGLACLSLLGWIAFWGGLAPQPGLDRWVPRYPAPMMEASQFILHYALYYLAVLGFQFAVVEAIVFRKLPPWERIAVPWVAAVPVGMAVLFVLAPPFLTDNRPGGIFGRATRLLLPGEIGDWIRVSLYYVLAVFAVVRVGLAGGLALALGAIGTLMSMKSQVPWEKYLLPCVLSLWYLRSRPDQAGGIAAVGAPRSD